MRKFKFLIFILGVCAPGFASAHAFGQQYTLPLPVWLYVYGGGLTVLLSFLLIGYFASNPNPKFLEKFKVISNPPRGVVWYKILTLVVLVITIVAGFVGSPVSTENLAPTMFWILFMLGFTYLVAIIGDVWYTINPVKTLAGIFAGQKIFEYPKQLGYIPAFVFYVFVICLELISGGAGSVPFTLSLYLVLYVGLTIIGSILFGVSDWFRYGDFFSVFFRVIAWVSPITMKDGKVILRFPFVGLLSEHIERISLLLFVIFMLSSTAFDGFRETIRALRILLSFSFIEQSQLRQFLLLVIVFAVFAAIYFAAVLLMKLLAKSTETVKNLSLVFGGSLVPIVIAYNLAHYYTLLLISGQAIIAMISDPFNLGWNLFGTKNFTVNVGIIGAKTVWESQVAFILLGHIAAVYIAHILALRVFKSKRSAFLSQLPMLVVMVVYTMTGLWILSQPLTIG